MVGPVYRISERATARLADRAAVHAGHTQGGGVRHHVGQPPDSERRGIARAPLPVTHTDQLIFPVAARLIGTGKAPRAAQDRRNLTLDKGDRSIETRVLPPWLPPLVAMTALSGAKVIIIYTCASRAGCTGLGTRLRP
jgi:hypothetical protein